MTNNQKAGNFLSRLVNVLYGIGWIILLLTVGLVFYTQKPYQYVDDAKSNISCFPSTKNYSFAVVDDYIDKVPNRYELDLYTTQNKAKYVCERVIEESLKYSDTKDSVWSEGDQKWFPNTPQNRAVLIKNVSPQSVYKVNEVTSTRNSWLSAIGWATIAFVILSIILDLLKVVLLYLVVGRKIQLKDFTLVKLFSGVEIKTVQN